MFIAGFVFAVLCFVTVNAISEKFSGPEYCGSCHEMQRAYKSWKASSHAKNTNGIRVECVDCHLPPEDQYFRNLFAKAHAGARDYYQHYFGPEYDHEKHQKEILQHMPDERCTYCHDSLLAKPSSPAVKLAQKQSLKKKTPEKKRCLECHTQLHNYDALEEEEKN